MKILHLPHSVGGLAWGLAQGEKALGHESRVLYLDPSTNGVPADEVLNLTARSRLGRWLAYGRTLLRHARGYDVYHFNFGASLIHYPDRGWDLLDLPLYDRRARKIFTYQGCDARQKYPTMERIGKKENGFAACFDKACYGGMCNSGVRDAQRRRAIDKAARYADHMFAVNPDLLRFLPEGMASFLPYAVAGALEAPAPKTEFFGDDAVHIVHAPTDRAAKGSSYILAALEGLREEMGDRLRVTVVEGMSLDQALAAYASADLVIDQVLIGWYGGVAVEAMGRGVPVVCYISDDDLGFLPPGMAADLPIIRATPFDIGEVVRRLIGERERLVELSTRVQAYVRRWHAPQVVAAMALKEYERSAGPDATGARN